MALKRIAWIVPAALLALPAFAGEWVDDFEDGVMSGWHIFNADLSVESWEEKDGVMTGQINAEGFFSILQLLPEGVDASQWKDYTVRVRMRLESEPNDDQNTAFGVMLYDHDLQLNQYHLCLLEYHFQDVFAYIRTDAGAGGSDVPFEVKQGVWYELMVSVETLEASELIVFQVDGGEPVAVNWGAQIGSGGLGLIVSDGMVSFDDFSVQGDNIPDGGSKLPTAVSPAGLSAQYWADLKE